MGAPPRSEAGYERVEEASSTEGVEGKTVERVAMEDRLRIRRANVADSWIVGMWCSGDTGGGLKRRYCAGEAEAETRVSIERRRAEGRNIFLSALVCKQELASR